MPLPTFARRSSAVFLVPLVLVALAVSCISIGQPGIDGSGQVVSQSRAAAGFDRVAVEDEFDVVVTVGPAHAVQVTGDDNLLPYVRTEVRGGTLHIETDRDLDPTRGIRLTVSTPSLVSLSASGSSDVRATGVRAAAFDASSSGSSDLVGEGDFGDLRSSVSGSGSMRLSGTADDVDAAVSGSGDLDLARVAARAARVRVSGSGSASVHAVETVNASVSGSGDVRYAGSPRVESSVSGSGSVRPAGSTR